MSPKARAAIVFGVVAASALGFGVYQLIADPPKGGEAAETLECPPTPGIPPYGVGAYTGPFEITDTPYTALKLNLETMRPYLDPDDFVVSMETGDFVQYVLNVGGKRVAIFDVANVEAHGGGRGWAVTGDSVCTAIHVPQPPPVNVQQPPPETSDVSGGSRPSD